MKFTRIKLKNWRNFAAVDVPLDHRVFLVGPNASGKSNFLDAFRFLRDVAAPRFGFQRAVDERAGVSRLRALVAGADAPISIEVDLELTAGHGWAYRLDFTHNEEGKPVVHREVIRRGNRVLVDRPDSDDREDPVRLTQPLLEQVTANRAFREVAEFFASVRYLHIVPQLIREPDRSVGRVNDPFGGDFLEQIAQIAKSSPRELSRRLDTINEALRVAVPQLDRLEPYRDERGLMHLRSVYRDQPDAPWQNEAQLSDGTLRLLGLLWSLLDGNVPLLLEEPELSLHAAVVRQLPRIMARIIRSTERQIFVSSHSADLLSERGISLEEVLILVPTGRGTEVRIAAEDAQIRALLDGDLSIAEAVLPSTTPRDATRLALIGG